MIKQTMGRIKTAAKAIIQTEFDALDLLRSDHMKLEAMLLQLRVFRDRDRRAQLLTQIRNDLEKHMRIEETIFYPTCAQVPKLKPLIDDSYNDHQEIKDILERLSEMSPSTQRFSKSVTNLIKTIETHVFEEENKLFPGVRKNMNEKVFRRLNREMQEAHSGFVRTRTRKAA